MKHRLVFAVIAKKRNVFAEIHIFQMIRDKTAVATLNAFAELIQNFLAIFLHFLILSESEKKGKNFDRENREKARKISMIFFFFVCFAHFAGKSILFYYRK